MAHKIKEIDLIQVLVKNLDSLSDELASCQKNDAPAILKPQMTPDILQKDSIIQNKLK